jgi:glycosyltransferase involved in cell wall biosynthesis
MSHLPEVSILTPVYDRKRFLPLMICNMIHLRYPKNKLEWVILDSWSKDGEAGEPLFKSEEEIRHYSRVISINIKYIYRKEALSIGKKRNMLVKEARHKYCINMDSDDIYLQDYILYSVNELIKNKKQCCGSPQMLFLYPNDNNKVTGINCPALRQIHEASMCFTKKHHKRMGGFTSSSQGEGAKMVDGCNPDFFIKTDISKCMICVCHNNNTVDKGDFNRDDITINDVALDQLPQMKVIAEIF